MGYVENGRGADDGKFGMDVSSVTDQIQAQGDHARNEIDQNARDENPGNQTDRG